MFELIKSITENMSGLDMMRKRLEHRGGVAQSDRMVSDKLSSLKRSLGLSYQTATAVLADGREFKCLINPNKIDWEIDDKMLSIPYENICLTSNESEPTNMKVGSTLEWKETKTHWLVYAQYLQETAYFRGLMRQCESEPLEINGTKCWYFLRRKGDKELLWQKTSHFIFNDVNDKVEIYISNNSITNEFFQRFKKLKIKGNSYSVEAVDRLTSDDLLIIYLKEEYENKWEDTSTEDDVLPEGSLGVFEGPTEVYPYDIVAYSLRGTGGGMWHISNNNARIVEQNHTRVTIEITTGKSGNVDLIYREPNGIELLQNISILSL